MKWVLSKLNKVQNTYEYFTRMQVSPPPGKNSAVRQKMGGKSLKLAMFNRIFTLISYFFFLFSIKSLKSLPSLNQFCTKIVKLGSLVSLTEWSNISERNSKLIENLKKGPELTL